MPRPKLTEEQQREIALRRDQEDESPTTLAEEFGVSRSTIYRVDPIETFQTANKYGEFGVSGVTHFGGSVQEDYLTAWRTLDRMVPLVKEMLDYPIIGSIIFAIEMLIRGAEWTVIPASEEAVDLEAAEFVDGCLQDMSHSFDDHITQAVSMVSYGFAPFELVYKKRLGLDKEPSSFYDDGKIGWRKFAFRSQDTLAPANEWVFDEAGGIRGMNQAAPPDYRDVGIPIEKMLLYRTTSVKNNPQGRSGLRSSYIAYYYAKNLQTVEGIAAERMGTGLPVFYLGKGTKITGNANDDFNFAKQIVRDVRADEQMGVVVPYPKQTADGTGALFDLVSPPSRGLIDFDQVIGRYNKQIAQTVLAQFIFLGMDKIGTQALAVRSTDMFTTAIEGWLKAIAETMNRHAIPRLMRLNAPAFVGMTGYPELDVGPLGELDVAKFMEALQMAVGSGALEMDEGIERTVRQILDLPEKEEATPSEEIDTEPREEPPGDQPQGPAGDGFSERFADKRGAGSQKLRKWERAVNAYQAELERIYGNWADSASSRLAEADPYEQDDVLDEELAALLLLLASSGRRNIINAVDLGRGRFEATPEMLESVAGTIRSNEGYVRDSLGPDIRTKLSNALRDPDVLLAGAVGVAGIMQTMTARVARYAGGYWTAIQNVVGEAAKQTDTGAVYWARDPRSVHCADCLEFGEQEYASFDDMLAVTGGLSPAAGVVCDGNCRCHLELMVNGDWQRP